MNISDIKHRDNLGEFLIKNNLCGVGVEVGCAHGAHAESILKSWPGTLIMVDPFEKYDGYKEETNETAPFEEWYLNCVSIAKRTGRSIVIRAFSDDASSLLPNDFLDFVYIDANHAYDYVRSDLDAWWPKVKSGGILCGHDYCNDTTTKGWDCEVKRAVEDWVTFGYPDPHLTPCSSWWIVKP